MCTFYVVTIETIQYENEYININLHYCQGWKQILLSNQIWEFDSAVAHDKNTTLHFSVRVIMCLCYRCFNNTGFASSPPLAVCVYRYCLSTFPGCRWLDVEGQVLAGGSEFLFQREHVLHLFPRLQRNRPELHGLKMNTWTWANTPTSFLCC